MHLLVLGTFWQHKNCIPVRGDGLNSPYGAGLFLIFLGEERTLCCVLMHLLVLGAFWHDHLRRCACRRDVLMHLLVLSAF